MIYEATQYLKAMCFAKLQAALDSEEPNLNTLNYEERSIIKDNFLVQLEVTGSVLSVTGKRARYTVNMVIRQTNRLTSQNVRRV